MIRTATAYVICGEISDEQFASIKALCIDPVDSREASALLPETLVSEYPEPADVKIFDGLLSPWMKQDCAASITVWGWR